MKTWQWIVTILISFALGFASFRFFAPDEPAPIAAAPASTAPIQVPAELLNITSSDGRFSGLQPAQALYIAYFGFTHCPDVCPTSLAMLSGAFNALSPQQLAAVQGLFITLDPKRDTPEKSTVYAGYFHPNIVGLTPHEGQLLGLSQQLGVYYKYVDTPDSAMEYSVDHNSFFYLLDGQGHLLERIPHTLDPQPLVDAIIAHIDN